MNKVLKVLTHNEVLTEEFKQNHKLIVNLIKSQVKDEIPDGLSKEQ